MTIVLDDNARAARISQALDLEERNPDAIRQRIPWKAESIRCTVINVELSAVVLNHRSHRIRAQLDGHSSQALVRSDPFGFAAQEVIALLLRETQGFLDIKSSLEAEGQHEPGVISREGVLINANTRAVALRDLGETYIDVMVLPEGATEDAISELELRLQVREELKQEYTFTNELLFIKDCINTGWSQDRIARELRYTIQTRSEQKARRRVEHQMRMLAAVEELRDMSNRRISYAEFDEAKQALIDMDNAYEALKKDRPEDAAKLRAARMVGILAGVGYRELRIVDSDFVDSHLMAELEDDPILGPLRDSIFEQATDSPNTTLLGGDDSAPDRAMSLLNWLTSTAGDANVRHTTDSGTKFLTSREEVIEALNGTFSAAVDLAKQDQSREDLIEQPIKRLKEARRKIRAATEAFTKARTDPEFDLAKVTYMVKKLAKESADFEARVKNESTRPES